MYEMIKSWRIEEGLTQEELAKKLFISPQALSLIENGKRTLTLDFLHQVSEALGKEMVLFVKERKACIELTEKIVKTELMRVCHQPGLINLDPIDVENIINRTGESYYAKATEYTAKDAVKKACEYFEEAGLMKQATGMMLIVEGGNDFSFDDLDDAATYIQERKDPHAQALISAIVNDTYVKGITIRLALTGIQEKQDLIS